MVYFIDKVQNDMTLEVNLKPIDGLIRPKQNIWEAVAMLDGKIFTDDGLSHCVNAKLAAENIGYKLRDDLKMKNKTFRIKKEEVK